MSPRVGPPRPWLDRSYLWWPHVFNGFPYRVTQSFRQDDVNLLQVAHPHGFSLEHGILWIAEQTTESPSCAFPWWSHCVLPRLIEGYHRGSLTPDPILKKSACAQRWIIQLHDGEGLLRIRRLLARPFAQHVHMQVQITAACATATPRSLTSLIASSVTPPLAESHWQELRRHGPSGLPLALKAISRPSTPDRRAQTVIRAGIVRKGGSLFRPLVHLHIEADHRYRLARMLEVNPGAKVPLGSASNDLHPQRFQDGSLGTRRLDDTFVRINRRARQINHSILHPHGGRSIKSGPRGTLGPKF